MRFINKSTRTITDISPRGHELCKNFPSYGKPTLMKRSTELLHAMLNALENAGGAEAIFTKFILANPKDALALIVKAMPKTTYHKEADNDKKSSPIIIMGNNHIDVNNKDGALLENQQTKLNDPTTFCEGFSEKLLKPMADKVFADSVRNDILYSKRPKKVSKYLRKNLTVDI